MNNPYAEAFNYNQQSKIVYYSAT